MMSLRPGCMVRTICGQLVTSCLHLGRFFLLPTLPSPPPTHPPPCNIWLKLMHTFKKSSEKALNQARNNFKGNCILFNRLLNPVLLNKSGLVQAKGSNFNLKSLNRCFSNYYQVRTWLVFAETVTYRLNAGIVRLEEL